MSQYPPTSPIELAQQVPPVSPVRAILVLVAGLLTTALTLAGVHYIQTQGDTPIMGLYGEYVIPIGAIIVGLAASSGYAIASLYLGLKIRKGLLGLIVLLMVVSYFATEYVEFKSMGVLQIPTGVERVQTPQGPRTVPTYRPAGFWEYFHFKAVNWTWKKENPHDPPGEPLGMAGYFFVLLGIVGFSLSGLILPAIVAARPYCDGCERYMKTRVLAILPGTIPAKKISKKDTDALAEQERAMQHPADEAIARLKRLSEVAQANDSQNFKLLIAQDPAQRKAAAKLLRKLEIKLTRCPSCDKGWLQAVWVTGKGKQIKRTKLPKIELTQDFIRSVSGV